MTTILGMGTRREKQVLKAFNPATGKLDTTVQISFERMRRVASRGLGHASEAAFILPYVLENPCAVYEGIRWENDEDKSREGAPGWRCYCAIPLNAFRQNGDKIAPYANQVFVVFVNHERVAYNWRWERSDPEDEFAPIGHKDRFKRRLK